ALRSSRSGCCSAGEESRAGPPPSAEVSAGRPAAGSQPAHRIGFADRRDAVGLPQFGDRARQVVAHRAFAQVQGAGDSGDRRPGRGGAEDVDLPGSERILPGHHRVGCKLRVDETPPAVHGADRPGQLVDGRVLGEEPPRPRGQRTAQVAGAAETREDENAAGGDLLVQCGCGLQPGHAGHFHVEHRNVRAVLHHCGHHFVAPAHFRDDFHVVFQVEQRGDRAPHEALVVSEDHSDHATAFFSWVSLTGSSTEAGTGRTARSRKPPLQVWLAVRVPPAEATRSDRPVSPLPNLVAFPARTPSLYTSTTQVRSWRESVMSQRCALLCRSTFVAPSRTSHAIKDWDCAGMSAGLPVTVAETPAASSTERTLASSSARFTARYPLTAARTSRSASRAIRCTSAISAAARSGSLRASRAASSLFTAIPDRLWPRRSCMSRANRSRSSLTASRARASRARVASRATSHSHTTEKLAAALSSAIGRLRMMNASA